jgi:class 3 adenylate cyclase/tetratricopeptide (TPR) repeat protein
VSISSSGARFVAYLPRFLVTSLGAGHDRTATGPVTLVFADISGFTALSERLASEGKVGAEKVTLIVNGAFEELLAVARLEGGDVISFGGDALLLAFTGPDHDRRAATAAWEMQTALDEYQAEASPVPLRMSVGVASGPVTAIAAGRDQRVVVLTGPTVDRVVALESAAGAGEILVSAETAEALDPRCRGEERSGGLLLVDEPEPSDVEPDLDTAPYDTSRLEAFIPPSLRRELGIVRLEGEHRPAVVGFLKFTGLTALAAVGPDSAADAVDALVDAAAAAAEAHEVTLLAVDVDADGGKLIFTGGVPNAVTNAEERMLRTMRRILDADLPVGVRAGVAVGDVFAGDLGSSFRRSYTVMGDTVNLAARLASAAVEGQLLTTERVASRSPTRFERTRLDPIPLKGKSIPIAPVAIGPMLGSTSSDTHGTELIGRNDELQVLIDAAEHALRGRGSVIDLVGPPGTGKTRLAEEVRRHGVIDIAMTIDCEEYEAGTDHHSIRVLLRHLLGIPQRSSTTDAAIRLTHVVEDRAPELVPWLPLLGVAADADIAPTPATEALDAAFRPARTAEAVGDLIAAVVNGPAVITVDNAQWIDASSREILDTVMLRQVDRPWLWVWSRTASGPAPSADLDPRRVELGPLTPDATAELLRSIRRDIDRELLGRIVERSGGNPLFALELARTVEGDLPASIERLISGRIDALLPRQRRLLRYASVLGQQFDLDLLAESLSEAASGLDDPELWDALEEFIEVSALGRVRFRHVLVRDVAYETLPFARRVELHATVADTIVRRARHRVRREAAVLALHYERAERHTDTWEYGVMAGDAAGRRWAPSEAATAYRRALAAAGHLPDVDPSDLARVAEAHGDALEITGSFDDAAASYEHALRIDSGRASAINRKLALLREKAGDYEGALHLAARAMQLAGHPAHRLEAMVALAGIRYRQGDFEGCADWCRQALDSSGSDVESALAHASYLLGIALTNLGRPDAIEHGERALEIYQRLGDHAGAGKVLNNLAIAAYYAGDWDRAADLYAQGREESSRAGDVVMTATLDNNTGEIRSDQGRLDEALALFMEASTTWTRARYAIGAALADSNLGRLATRRGDPKTAGVLLKAAVEAFDRIGAEALSLEARTRQAELSLVAGDASEAAERARALLERLRDAEWATPLRLILLRVIAHASPEDAPRLLEEAVDEANRSGIAYERALALRALAGVTGDPAQEAEAGRVLDRLGATDAPALPFA